ncbi:MAG: UDP-N-acetylglucosamine 2-epimerase [Terriglobales bacterium]
MLTLHRPANVDGAETLAGLVRAAREIGAQLPVIFPVHPRTRERMRNMVAGGDGALRPIAPLGYLDFLRLMDQARLVFTDSGGIQEETTVLGVPCLTLRENTERPATLRYGTNQLVGTDPARIVTAARESLGAGRRSGSLPPLWDGHAAERIADLLRQGQAAVPVSPARPAPERLAEFRALYKCSREAAIRRACRWSRPYWRSFCRSDL